MPIISTEEYEDFAEWILQEYYPEGLKTRNIQPIDTLELAKRMGLNVIERCIDKNCLVFGQKYFRNKKVSFYDEKVDEYREEVVEDSTIVIDSKNFFLRNIGSVSNTIAHEIVIGIIRRHFC